MSALASSPHAPVTLADLLDRPDVWRGDALAATPRPGQPTGYGELDAQLPGGGWPRGALSELLAPPGTGVAALLAPALAACSGPLLLVAPPWPVHAPGWAGAGIVPGRLTLVEATGQDGAWTCETALALGGFAALLAWLPEIDARGLRRLQLAAEGFGGPAFIVRPQARGREASPAPLRLTVANAPRGLQVQITKRRSGSLPPPLLLQPTRALAPFLERDRALALPASAPAAPGRPAPVTAVTPPIHPLHA